jgi:hypothetical protein
LPLSRQNPSQTRVSALTFRLAPFRHDSLHKDVFHSLEIPSPPATRPLQGFTSSFRPILPAGRANRPLANPPSVWGRGYSGAIVRSSTHTPCQGSSGPCVISQLARNPASGGAVKGPSSPMNLPLISLAIIRDISPSIFRPLSACHTRLAH